MPDIFNHPAKKEKIRIKRKFRVTSPAEDKPADKPLIASIPMTPKQDNGHRSVDHYSEVMRAEKPTSNMFKAYAPKPLGVNFTVQEEEEVIILMLRQHPVTQLKWVAISLILALMPLFLNSISFFSFLPPSYELGVILMWYLFILGYIFKSFLRWFFNIYLITDERIIDIDFYNMIRRNMATAKIDRIEDVTATNKGFLGTMFDEGSVVIQTASEKREFEFDGIPHPARVVTLINELILEEERETLEGRVR